MDKNEMPPEAAAWGQPIQTYMEKGYGCALIGLVFLALYGLGFIIAGIVMLIKEVSVASFGAIFTGLVLVVPSVWAYNRKTKHDPTGAQGYEEGLVVQIGKKTVAVRWQEIAAIHENLQSMHGLDSITLHPQWPHMRIYLQNGQLFSFNLLKDGKPIGDLIRRKTAALVVVAAQECIDAGQTVKFGELTLSSAGIQLRNKTLPWNQALMQVKEEKCEIWDKTSSRWDRYLLRGPAEKVPNLVALFALMEAYREPAKAAA